MTLSLGHIFVYETFGTALLLLLGCVQPAMAPNINSATARVLDAAGIQTLVAEDAGCCGALRTHLARVLLARVVSRLAEGGS